MIQNRRSPSLVVELAFTVSSVQIIIPAGETNSVEGTTVVAMIIQKIHFRGHRCFKKEWAGLDTIKPVNVIIGRNNTGKSHLLDLIATLCDGKLKGTGWHFLCQGVLTERLLKREFQENTSGGALGGYHWESHGRHFVNVPIRWQVDEHSTVSEPDFASDFDWRKGVGEQSARARIEAIMRLLPEAKHPFAGRLFRRLLADRDIRPEMPSLALSLDSDGRGASNVIRRHLVSSDDACPRELIQSELLKALNQVFGADGQFTEIQVKLHDHAQAGQLKDHWEVYLGEEKKGLIPLSRSGSGLKTVILVLLNLLIIPPMLKKEKANCVFAFEELENNLHPALLRRLLQFLESYALSEKACIFLTTHSSTALDLFGVSKNAQIIHVTHDGEVARAATVSAHFDHLGVISELGAKPSDLLQANGIIWVEGPSDCIYINRWLDLYSEGRFQEGRDYLCAFYGGSLLARTQFKPPEEAERELINLFRVNPNIIVICDGDRSGSGKRVKDRVRRIRAEVKRIPGAHMWVTTAREIENYIPGSVLAKATSVGSLPDPDQYEPFFPRKGFPKASYVEKRLNRKGQDKMDLAILSVPHMTKAAMVNRFEWNAQMKVLSDRITSWNR